ncbi:FUSC family protein [Promicromonospora umidemergens]|uniref:Integral membrane bound transporter domain-containing protein n=1 Tax=Promicromonospora umidemergens TaxID=629679 RepID=A0ABP8WSV3_9MICO|nr:FUSC family protein [Promicromonospora umidemergens]
MTSLPGSADDMWRKAMRTLVLRTRLRQGWTRARAGLLPIAQASLAAGIAYAVAHYVLGHEMPFFAPVAAWVCLGFTALRDVRRVAEMAVGVAVGVGMGDLLVHLIGSGWWQLTVVLFIAAIAARFIDRGALLVIQAGAQAIIVVGLPSVSGGPIGRWTDALIGGAIALLVALLTPGDTRRRPRALAEQAVTELAETLETLARGMRSRDVDDVGAALVRGRASEPVLAEWQEGARAARELARISVGRMHRGELARLEGQAVLVDRTMRSVRVLARRVVPVLEGDHDVDPVAGLVEGFASAVRQLASDVGSGGDGSRGREALTIVAAQADPRTVGEGDWQVQSLVMLLRSPIVDTLEAAGASPGEARDALPEL